MIFICPVVYLFEQMVFPVGICSFVRPDVAGGNRRTEQRVPVSDVAMSVTEGPSQAVKFPVDLHFTICAFVRAKGADHSSELDKCHGGNRGGRRMIFICPVVHLFEQMVFPVGICSFVRADVAGAYAERLLQPYRLAS